MNSLPKKQRGWKAFFISLALHALVILSFSLEPLLHTTREIIIPKRILVQTVSLRKPPKQMKNIALPEEEPKMEPIEEIAEEEPLPPKEDPPKEEKKEETPPAPTPEEPAPEELAPKEPATSVKEKAPQQKENRASAPSKKAPPKKKGPVKKVTPKKTTTPVKSAKKPQEKKKTYDAKLLQEAMSSLNKSRTASSRKSTATASKTSSKKIGTIRSLHSEQGLISESSEDENQVSSSQESNYIVDLIRRLQLHIRLPEPGEVQIRLTLNKNGSLSSLEIIRCRSEKIRSSIKEKVSSIVFSPFGSSFSGESSHTFRLKLSNDLTWSSF